MFDELSSLREDVSPELQLSGADEDLLQVAYAPHYVIDVGWYQSIESQGNFMIFVIKDSNWEQPVFKKNTTTWPGLKQCLDEAIELACKLQHAEM